MRSWFCLGICLAILWPVSSLQAQVFLVSAGYYSSQANGANNIGSAYRYSTNNAAGNTDARLTLNLAGNIQSNAISYPLALGSNNFTFSVTAPFSPGNFGGLLLFFNSTGTSFNPPNTSPITADLAAVTPTTNSGAFFIPAAGIQIRDYVGNNAESVPYTGATSFSVGGFDVSISTFSSTNSPSGSFTLSVSAVPEPATWAMIALCASGATALGWKYQKSRYRRRKK